MGKEKKYQNVTKTSQKNMIKIVMQDIFLKQILITQKRYLMVIKIYHFYPKEKSFKKNMLFI